MRHRVFGKQLSRTTSHRQSLRRNMAASLFMHGAIRTTPAKAKELRRFAERLITLARKGTLAARRTVLSALGRDRDIYDDEGELQDKTVVQKLFDEIAPRYADRPGGYTRIIALSERRIGDAGRQVILQLVQESAGRGKGGEKRGKSRRRRRAEKLLQAASRAAAAGPAAGPAEPAEQPLPAAAEQPAAPESPAAAQDQAAPAAEQDPTKG